MRTTPCSLWALILAASTALAPIAAHAQAPDDAARSSARQLATEASEAYRAGQWDMAYDRFNRAFKLVGVPALGVWSARSLEQGGKLVESSERYREVLALKLSAPGASDIEAQQNARAELDELLPRIPNVTIQVTNVSPAQVEVLLDGKRVPAELLEVKQQLNPGKHHIEARHDGEFFERDVVLGERASEQVAFEFQAVAEPAAPAATSGGQQEESSGFDGRTVGWVSVGLGGAFLASGLVTGFIGLDKESAIKGDCPNGVCSPGSVTQGEVDDVNLMRTLSTVSFIGAGVFGALGVTLILTGGSSNASTAQAASPQLAKARAPELGARFTPQSVQLFGTF
ncbi:MAG TPA: hypothetical protein VLC09_05915 [Polyangiaceae bacterium]|nr:hypothetical protein [Polyangiaceae bacterium]